MSNKKRLIVIEGSDGTGKTTQAKILAEKLKTNLVIQPSKDNIVSIIREEAKHNPAYTALERQLLIAISHTCDAFTLFDGTRDLVMDRSYISGLVYGKITGVEKYELALLDHILSNVYKHNTQDKYDVHILFLRNTKRLDEPDNDVFEQQNWDSLSREYDSVYDKLKTGCNPAFSQTETVTKIDIDGKNIDEVAKEIETIVGYANN